MVLKLYLTRGIVKFDDKYLFLKKVKDVIPENVGRWECPGGIIRDNEEPEETVLREVKEETGLECKIIKELPFLQMTTESIESKCHVFLLKAPSKNVILSPEHSEYRWVKAEEVKSLALVQFAGLLLEYFEHPKIYLG